MSSVIFLRLRRQEKGSWTKWRDPDRQEASGPADELDASPGTSPRHTSSGTGAVDIAMAATVCGAAVGDTGGDSAEEWQFTHGSDGRTEQMAGCPHRRAIWMRRQPTRQLTRHCPAADMPHNARQDDASQDGAPSATARRTDAATVLRPLHSRGRGDAGAGSRPGRPDRGREALRVLLQASMLLGVTRCSRGPPCNACVVKGRSTGSPRQGETLRDEHCGVSSERRGRQGIDSSRC